MISQLKESHDFFQKLIQELGFNLAEELKQMSYSSIYDLRTISFSFKALKREFPNSLNDEVIQGMKDYISTINPHPTDRALMFRLGCF